MTAAKESWRRHIPPPLRERDFAFLFSAQLCSNFAGQMVAVAIGWQVSGIHHSRSRAALDLGLIGLAEFVPLPLLALPMGQLADRISRRLMYAVSLVLESVVVVLLLVVSIGGAHALWPFLALAAGAGVAGAIGSPASRALSPNLVPEELLPSAMALRTMTMQLAVVTGPALGGLLFAVHRIGPEVVYGTAAALLLVAGTGAALIHEPAVIALEPDVKARGLESLLGGLRLVRRTPVLLGAISLDLFAVLFGGAVALIPLFAREMNVGSTGSGIMRAAPALGAVVAGTWLTRRPLRRREGRTLLIVVAGFGASMVVFGLSHSFALTLVALAASGFTDMISMNVRGVTVAMATPDELRGRVSAVEMVFISASNELGAFESGAAAWLIGAAPAVVAGGIVTIGLAVVWKWLFPALANVDGLVGLRPGRVP